MLLYFFEAEKLNTIKTLVPLSAKSFCSVSLHKKDTAAIGARLEMTVLRRSFMKELFTNKDVTS